MTPSNDTFGLRGTKCDGSYHALCEHLDTILGPEKWRMSYRWLCQEKIVCKVEIHHPDVGDQYPWVVREATDQDPHNAFREAVCRWGVVAGPPPDPENPDDLLRKKYLEKIGLATTMDDLNAVGSELADVKLPDKHMELIRSAWKARKQEIEKE